MANNNDQLKKLLLFLIPLIFLVFAIYLPLFTLFYTIYSTGSINFRELANPLLWYSVKISFLQAGLSAVLSFLIGYPGGIIFARYSFPGKKLLRSILLVPFLLPSIVVAVGILDVFSVNGFFAQYVPALSVFSYGLPGIIYANVFFNAPLIMFFTYSELESFEKVEEDCARTLGSSGVHLFRKIIWPHSKSGAFAGMLIAFIYSFMGFTIPLIIGGAKYFTMENWIYATYFIMFDLKSAVIFSVIELVFLLLPSMLYIYWIRQRTRRFLRYEKEREFIKLSFSRPAELFSVIVYLIFIMFFIFPVLFVPVVSSLQVPHTMNFTTYYYSLLFSPTISFKLGIVMPMILINTLFFALVASLIVLLVTMLAVLMVRESKKGWSFDLFWFLPLVISPIILALAMFLAFRVYLNVGSTVWPLIIMAQSVIAIPLTLRILTTGLAHVQPELRDSAILLGASKIATFFKIELPLIKRSVITAFLFSFAVSIGEFAATNFLYLPKYTTLTISIYKLLQLREFALANVAASILIILSFIYFFLIQAYGEKQIYG